MSLVENISTMFPEKMKWLDSVMT